MTEQIKNMYLQCATAKTVQIMQQETSFTQATITMNLKTSTNFPKHTNPIVSAAMCEMQRENYYLPTLETRKLYNNRKQGGATAAHNMKGWYIMKHKRAYIHAYINGHFLCEVIQAALDNNMTVDDMKKVLINANPNFNVTFKVVRK